MERNKSLEIADIVALTLRPGAAPLRCYVGQIVAIDSTGINLTLIDWPTREFVGASMFAPWSEVTSALVGGPDSDESNTIDAAEKWQASMNNQTS